ncbi:MAG: peptidylprolyl isomerase [Nanoarchaeota archaeon]|nr:peptidylprolyl isomerase [Nanoarchaeota archaeon]
MNKIIEQKLQIQYAKQNRIEATKSDIDNAIEEIKTNNNFSDEMLVMALEREGLTIEKYRTSLKQQITLSKILSSEVGGRIKVNEKEIVRHYKKNKKKFLTPEEVKASHIIFVVNNKEDRVESAKQRKKALRVLKLVKKGKDFKELARTYSEGPSKNSGGDLGWVKKGAMISSFEKAAFSLGKDEISGLVKTDYGYHIIKVEDRREAKNRTLDETRDEIQKILYKKKYNEKLDNWMVELKKDAFIEIYLDKKSLKKRHASLNAKKRHRRVHGNNTGSRGKIRKKAKIKKLQNTKANLKSISSEDKIKISKFILKWEKARETKNRRRYFSFYSKDVRINGMTRKEWKKTKEC